VGSALLYLETRQLRLQEGEGEEVVQVVEELVLILVKVFNLQVDPVLLAVGTAHHVEIFHR
jgi:hypothetical protein